MHGVVHGIAANSHALEGAFFGVSRILRRRLGGSVETLQVGSPAAQGVAPGLIARSEGAFKDRAYWEQATLPYAEPYFRVEKCARVITRLAGSQPCDLLDVGCGPATLERLLPANMRYFGVDLAIHEPSANLLELDLAVSPLQFEGRKFDIVVAAGLFEYLDRVQDRVLREIREILNDGGKFVVTYTNFHQLWHHRPTVRAYDTDRYNNKQSLRDFRRSLERQFVVDRWFPSSHNTSVREPTLRPSKAMQLGIEHGIPLLSRMLAVNYFFICRPLGDELR